MAVRRPGPSVDDGAASGLPAAVVGQALEGPAAFVHGDVVSPAEQGEVLHVGVAGVVVVGPEDQVMSVAKGRRFPAVGKHAAAVADVEIPAMGARRSPPAAAELQDRRSRPGQTRDTPASRQIRLAVSLQIRSPLPSSPPVGP
jgi:hypothetical protein